MYGVQIAKMAGDFIKEESGEVCLVNIARLQYTQVASVGPKEDLGFKTTEIFSPQQNKQIETALQEYFKNLERGQAVKILNKAMNQHYKDLKSGLGVLLPENYYEDNISDEVFAKIHPRAPFKLSDLIRSELSYEKIRDFVIKNNHQLRGFQKYLYDGQTTQVPIKKTYVEDTKFAFEPKLEFKRGKSFRKAVIVSHNGSKAPSPTNSTLNKQNTSQSDNRSVSVPRIELKNMRSGREGDETGRSPNASITNRLHNLRYFFKQNYMN